jgi:hypothetical protein
MQQLRLMVEIKVEQKEQEVELIKRKVMIRKF